MVGCRVKSGNAPQRAVPPVGFPWGELEAASGKVFGVLFTWVKPEESLT